MSARFSDAAAVMRRAIELAAQGIGAVEPNPPVGAVLVDDQLNPLAEGYHQRFGGPHAEIEAITRAADHARGATLFVTLEPCCHQGKTGPCTEAILRAGIRNVVVAQGDPFPAVAGKGIERLRLQGVKVEVGLLSDEAQRLTAPYVKLVTRGEPWIHAKWAMSLDGKIATSTGESRWISGEASRGVVHRLRGRMDAVIVGVSTALRDDPLLTARPAGTRLAARVIVDSEARLPVSSQLVRTAREIPLLVAASSRAPAENIRHLQDQGAEVLTLPAAQMPAVVRNSDVRDRNAQTAGLREGVDLSALMKDLGRRQFTNVLVEGGGRLLGSLFDAGLADEIHVFVAPRIVGGAESLSPVAGRGHSELALAENIAEIVVERLGDDVYINGRRRPG